MEISIAPVIPPALFRMDYILTNDSVEEGRDFLLTRLWRRSHLILNNYVDMKS